MSAIQSVGFVAFGRMGQPMARHAAARGFSIQVFDPGATAKETGQAAGYATHETPADLARATQLAMITVPGDDDLRAVVTGEGGLLECASPDFLIVVSSSVHPDTMRDLAGICRARGVGLIDAPVTGGIRGAEAGRLTVLAGGEEADIDRARPVFDSFAAHVHHLGPAGAGQVAKMVNNMLLWANYMAAGQALEFADKAGLDPETIRAVMADCTGESWALRVFPDVRPIWPVKDMKTVSDMLAEMGLSLPLIEHVAANAQSISIES